MAAELTATIVLANQIAPNVRELTVQLEGDSVLEFRPGQWLSFNLPLGEKASLIRAYSIANAPKADGTLTLCFDRIEGGAGSEYLWNLEVGSSLEFTGPLGNFTLPDGDQPLVFVARYTGIVPFRAMLQAIERGDGVRRTVHMVYGMPSDNEMIYHNELAELAARAGWFDYHPITATLGDEISILTRHASDWMPFIPMVCGVRDFTFPARAFFIDALGFERRAVKVENYNGPTVR